MRTLKWAFWILVALAAGGFLTYTLPSNDIVRIVGSEVRRVEIGPNGLFWAGGEPTDPNSGNRDVKFISAVLENGKTRVYRNEDTGWIWPPYFKYDSSNLHAQATDLKSTAADPRWVNVTSYGWRISWLSIYPNAISVRPVAGPDVRPFNWPAQLILALIGAFLFLIWRMWNQFRERTIDPAVRSADEAWDRLDARADAARDHIASEASEAQGRVRRWWNGIRGR